MSAVRYWLVAAVLTLGLPLAGVPIIPTILIAAPFAMLAGWHLGDPPAHVCGWCGRSFGGPYEWCCPDCEGEVVR